MHGPQLRRTVIGGALATVALAVGCLVAIHAPAVAGMRWDASVHRSSAVEAGGQRLIAAAPLVSELNR